ncbi:TetR/AcrR family transcriptional regulator [Gorillibacterium sp. sgz5001074]|uniref:TetR/AcrR family transcriptional regulator n=1 Tax=Gorillibacterium sp. sgz5001074 TaxID=3446695 RepID=UPI003F662E57
MPQDMEQWLSDLVRLTDEDDSAKMTDKQAKILEAAIEIFAEKGYSATSTSEIAQKAGVAEGTIFRHYKTKKDLLLSIVGPILTKLVAPFFIRDFAKLLDLPYSRMEDFYRAVAKNRIQFARSNAKLLRILIHEVPFQPELSGQVKTVFTEHVYTRVEKVIRHFQEQGQVIEAPPFRIIRTAVSLILGYAITHVMLMPDYPVDDDEEINHLVDLLMYGISPRP